MNNMLKAGLLSVGTVFFWGLLNVGLRFLVVEYGCHPLALACSNALFCALALIAIGDPKVKILPILRNWNTWFFGLTQILKNICLIYAFVYISSTQTNLLTNIEIVFSLLLTWIFLHRRPNRIDLLAIGFILIGWLVVVAGLPPKNYDCCHFVGFWRFFVDGSALDFCGSPPRKQKRPHHTRTLFGYRMDFVGQRRRLCLVFCIVVFCGCFAAAGNRVGNGYPQAAAGAGRICFFTQSGRRIGNRRGLLCHINVFLLLCHLPV